jgi:regulation of enolase protein 1 (concanavalin A-like superfamily)
LLGIAALWAVGAPLADASGRHDRHDGDEEEVPLDEARIFFEYNSTDNDLGVHVFLDADDWRKLSIEAPNGRKLFSVDTKGGYRLLGLTEISRARARPRQFARTCSRSSEGEYEFEVRRSGRQLEAMPSCHAIAGPATSARR